MKKVIRLNENDIEKLVKKIIKEESVNPEWFQDVSEPSQIYSFLFNIFNTLKTESVMFEEYGLTFYTDQNNEVILVKKTKTDGTNGLYLDAITVVRPLDEMGLSDDEIESSVKKMFKEFFNEDIQRIQYHIPGSYLQAFWVYI